MKRDFGKVGGCHILVFLWVGGLRERLSMGKGVYILVHEVRTTFRILQRVPCSNGRALGYSIGASFQFLILINNVNFTTPSGGMYIFVFIIFVAGIYCSLGTIYLP